MAVGSIRIFIRTVQIHYGPVHDGPFRDGPFGKKLFKDIFVQIKWGIKDILEKNPSFFKVKLL